MNKFDLPDNFVDNLEALIRRTRAKLKKVWATTTTLSSSQLEALPSELEDQASIFWSLTPEFDVMANKSLCEFLAPATDNIRTGPAADIEKSFELKPALINMVQAS
jgi:hypothetical protein